MFATLGGYVGLTIGWVEGFELNFFGGVLGFDLRRPALKFSGLGRIGMGAGKVERKRGSEIGLDRRCVYFRYKSKPTAAEFRTAAAKGAPAERIFALY